MSYNLHVNILLCHVVPISHYPTNKTLYSSVVGPMMSMVPTITVKISVVINPILHIGFNSQVEIYKILINI